MPERGLRLLTLGGLSLCTGAEAGTIPVQRRKLALLAVLAISARPIPRDILIAMFWGDEDEERARHSLSNALSSLRRLLGPAAIATRSQDITLAPGTPLTIDALDFEVAARAGDTAAAFALYRGPFLDGVFIERSNEFEDWRSARRARYAALFLDCCQRAAGTAAERGDGRSAAETAMRWTDAAPDATAAQLALLTAGLRSDDASVRTAVLAHWQSLASRREESLDPAVTDAERQLMARMTADARTSMQRSVPDHGEPVPPRKRGRAVATIAASLLALVAIAAFLWNRDRDTPPPERPTVVVAGLQTLSGDSADAWLGDGLQQMISADLARSTAVEVVAPSRLRAVLARARLGTQRTLADDAARTVADRLGAEWVVSGGISYGGDRLLVLDVNVRDVKSGHRLALFSVTGRDPMAVADQAAARILTQASASLPGPRLAQTETASLAGYEHYVRAEQATAEGRDAEATEELDAAIAADSGFISAIVERMRRARYGDPAMLERLSDAYARAATRATEYDQLDQALFSALHNGEHTRAEALGREMVAHYPHDPRVYATLADVLASHGKWSEADSVLREAIALDSSAAAAGSGPCAPCAGYSGLVSLRVTFGDTHEAEVAARRWVTLQPAVPLAWAELADVLSYEGRYPDAIAAAQRARLLGGVPGEPYYDARLGNLLLRARRYGDVDTLIARWSGDRRQEVRSTAADLDALLQRERGQFLESAHTIARAIRADSGLAALELMEANSLARAGYIDSALALMHHAMLQGEPEVAPVTSLAGDRARKFSWEHALLADLQATTADTSVLRALADSIDRISTRSYYGRDWHLAHHVRGLIAERAGNWADAVREFSEARWGRAGWTRTNVELARADLELGLADSAIAVLRDAYRGPLDAMGRYVPRGELDAWMARAETAAGHADSAAVYEGYVRDARQGGQGGRS